MKQMIIAGGTGFLGNVLENFFSQKGYKVKILTRNPTKENHVFWDAKHLDNWIKHIENCDILINLAGKSVDCRYTQEHKQLIHDSRIDSTAILGEAINLCKNPPKVWLNSSTATIYRHSLDKLMTEEDGEIGNDFSMNIAKSWEKAFNNSKNPKTRKVILRTSIVLGKHGGALIPLKNLTQFGLGGKQGKGNQKVSWIHEIDFARAIEFIINDKSLEGVFNLCVPQPTNNALLMESLRKTLHMPFGLSHPKWMLEIGAKLIGTETELVLKSRNVTAQGLLENGFKFHFNNIEVAVQNLLKN